jgi:hypothetical protein
MESNLRDLAHELVDSPGWSTQSLRDEAEQLAPYVSASESLGWTDLAEAWLLRWVQHSLRDTRLSVVDSAFPIETGGAR